MTITIQIATDGAAFEGENFAPELRVVLMKLVDAMTAELVGVSSGRCVGAGAASATATATASARSRCSHEQ